MSRIKLQITNLYDRDIQVSSKLQIFPKLPSKLLLNGDGDIHVCHVSTSKLQIFPKFTYANKL